MAQCRDVCVSLPPVNLKQGLQKRNCAGLLVALCNPSKIFFLQQTKSLPTANVTAEVSLLACIPVQAGSANRTSICPLTANPSLPALNPLVQIFLVRFLALPDSCPQALLIRGQATNGWQKHPFQTATTGQLQSQESFLIIDQPFNKCPDIYKCIIHSSAAPQRRGTPGPLSDRLQPCWPELTRAHNAGAAPWCLPTRPVPTALQNTQVVSQHANLQTQPFAGPGRLVAGPSAQPPPFTGARLPVAEVSCGTGVHGTCPRPGSRVLCRTEQ